MELHDAFTRWLIAGQGVSLARDVAVHASACPDCLRAAAGFDALDRVDAASAPEPPVGEIHPDGRAGVIRGALWAAGVTALFAVAVTSTMAFNGVFDSIPNDPEATAPVAEPSTSLTEGVLGNQASPRASADERSASPSVSASSGRSVDADASAPAGPGVGIAAPTPTFWGQPVPTGSYRPSASPSAGPTAISTPAPTATATPTATPTSTPTPTPTPLPVPACSNFVDDDGDGLVDFGEDPGCESPIDDDETDPPPP